MSLLGSLLCFPNHLREIPVLDPNARELVVIKCTDVKVSYKAGVLCPAFQLILYDSYSGGAGGSTSAEVVAVMVMSMMMMNKRG